MPVFRVNKTSDYTVMSNSHFKIKDMSLKAKGLLSLILSLPDGWDYSVSGFCAMCKENQSAIKSALDELKQFGFLTITKRMPDETNSGRIEYEYNIYETPQNQGIEKQGAEKQGVEKQCVEKQGVENPIQLNTNTLNTNKTSTNIQNTKKQNKAASGIDAILIEWVDKNIPEHSRESVHDLLNEWVKVRKQKRAANTVRAIELNLEKLIPCASSSNMTVSKYLEEVICRGWQAFYEIPNMNGGQSNGKYARPTGGDTDYSRGEETLGTML